MKKTLDKFFEILGYLWSFVYTIHLKDKFIWIHYLLYFGWIKRHFKHLGSVYFKMPTYINNPQCVEIDDGTCIGKRVIISATIKNGLKTFTPSVTIGKNCNIGDDSNIQCCNCIKLGNGVLLGRKIMINDTSHGRFERNQLDIQPNLRPLGSKGSIVIDDNVWIGEMVCILGNVHIGQGAVIGAGAVVTKDIPPYSLAVGAPAKVIKSFDK